MGTPSSSDRTSRISSEGDLPDWTISVKESTMDPTMQRGGCAVTDLVRYGAIHRCLAMRRDRGVFVAECFLRMRAVRSEEHTSELQSLMRISYAVFCLKKKTS